MTAASCDRPRLPRASLFVKIFLCFWICMTVLGIALLWQEASRSAQLSKRWRGVTADAFAIYAQVAADTAESDGRRELDDYLAALERRTSIEAYLLNERGEDDFRAGSSRRLFRESQSRWMRAQMQGLARRAADSPATVLVPLGTVTLAGRAARTDDGRRFVLVGVLPSARYGPFNASPEVQALRMAAVLLVAGLVCWGLGRHLASPVESLRAATRKLAGGDLTARTGLPAGRRDELAELARDFDSMAERLEVTLEEKERMVSAQRHLMADVSHELRSPLARLTVALELARDRTEELLAGTSVPPRAAANTTLEEALNRIEAETVRLSELIARLLVLARMESGVQQPDIATVDLTELVGEIVADAGFEARSHGRSIDLFAEEGCYTSGTQDLLRSAIENVIRNAMTHTPEETAIDVSVRAEHPFVVIEVRDRGPGIPENQLTEVFRPFYRTSPTRERKSGGVGLGLSITARAVQLHGGQVRARNADGGGLIVSIGLPLSQAPAAGRASAP